MMLRRSSVLVGCALLLLAACTTASEEELPEKPTTPEVSGPPTPLFDPDSAYAFVERQVAFGARVPGSEAHRACGDWLAAKLKGYGAAVIEQEGTVKAFNGQQLPVRNIIASWKPEAEDRLLLFAHWDTRPFADKDLDRKNEPIDGANDGGSGVGVWLEVARHFAEAPPALGIDLIFFDVEDYGQPSGAMGVDQASTDTWCLGSQYWTRNLHVPGYTARYGILLDMVGDADLQLTVPANSSNELVRHLLDAARATGQRDRVALSRSSIITDDHVPFLRLGIPAIDLIDFRFGSKPGLNDYWHTSSDHLQNISAQSLEIVGGITLQMLVQLGAVPIRD